MDFDPINKATNDDLNFREHNGVFIRVNDRTYDSVPSQTRFGTIVYTHDSNVAYLQFDGDKLSNPSEPKGYLYSFGISDQPFDDGTETIWRLQIHERKVLQPDYIPMNFNGKEKFGNLEQRIQ